MTDDEWNAAMATEVMGDGYAARHGIATKTDRFRSQLWSPVTDIADAFEVVWEMQWRGWDVFISITSADVIVSVDAGGDAEILIVGESRLPRSRENAPHAICEAALQAIRHA